MSNNINKIFCIGLSRTGTTSIALALSNLGYKASALPFIYKNTHFLTILKLLVNRILISFSKRFLNKRIVMFKNTYSRKNNLKLIKRKVDEFGALSDTPTVRFYKELDELYPNSKFILTVRDSESWLASCKRHFQKRYTGGKFDQINFDIYGTNIFNREMFLTAYEKHLNEVLDYFKYRKEDLLVLNIVNGEGYDKICSFLGVCVPEGKFPNANSNKPQMK